MKNKNKFLTVPEMASELNVSEETVRRWIRNKQLRAFRSGKEFIVNSWDLEYFLATGGYPSYDDSNLLLHASLGIKEATKGALLFDQSYFKLEKQWERIKEDEILYTKKYK